LAVTLAESCILERGHEIGASVELPLGTLSKAALLFGESQSRVVISVSPKNVKSAEEMIESSSVPFRKIGKVGGSELRVSGLLKAPLAVLSHTWRNAIGRRMNEKNNG
jgi:phosphoribosylformylglycinamidine synthase